MLLKWMMEPCEEIMLVRVCVFCNIWKLGKGKFENKRAIFEILADSKFKLCLTLLLINAALKDPRRWLVHYSSICAYFSYKVCSDILTRLTPMSLLSDSGISLSLSPAAHLDFTSCAFEEETANSIRAFVCQKPLFKQPNEMKLWMNTKITFTALHISQ